MATLRNLTPEQQENLDAEIAAVEKPVEREAGFWDAFLVGVGDVLAGGRGVDAVGEYQKEVRTMSEKARTKYEEKIAELKKRALERADRDYADPTTPVSAKRAEIEATKLYELGNNYLDMANKPHLKQMWTPEMASTFVRNRSAKDIDTDNNSLTNGVLGAIRDLINQENELIKADKAIAAEKTKVTKDLLNRQRELNNQYRAHPVKKMTDKAETAYAKFQEQVATNKSGIRDIGLITSFVKAYDPESAIKEGEIRLVREGMPDLKAFVTRVNKFFGKNGAGIIPPSEYDSIIQQMNAIIEGQRKQLEVTKDEFRAQAEAEGIDPEKVIVDVDAYRAKKGGGKKDAAGLLNKVKF